MSKNNWHEILEIPKEINILGETYQIVITRRELSDLIDERDGATGACAVYEPLIELYSDEFEDFVTESETREQKAKVHHTFRHEIVHALFIQSGLDYTYGDDECLVDFLAVQIPKIKKYM